MNLRQFDLNLLVVFEAMMAEGSVHRAAERIGLSQPAASNALGRLRAVLGDELFVRSRKGMVPTARATAIAPNIRTALSLVEKAISRASAFEPDNASRTFKLGMTDFAAAVLMPSIAKRLAKFESLRLHVLSVDRQNYSELLDRERVDLVIGWFPDIDRRHGQELLFRDSWVVAAARTNRRAKVPIDATQYANMRHVVFSPHGEAYTVIDRLLRHKGIRRNTIITVSQFDVVLSLVAGSDYITTISERLAAIRAPTTKFKIMKMAFLTDRFDVVQIWNRRNEHQPDLMWLREQIRAAASST